MEQFNELQYRPPTQTANEYAKQAITILRDLLESDPSSAVYVMQPSAILLFTGLRAESPYHEFDKSITSQQRQSLSRALAKHNIYIFEETLPDDEASSYVFSLISPAAVSDLASRYRFFEQAKLPPYMQYSRLTFIEWTFIVERQLAGYMEVDELPKEWLRDWWAPHNLRFGMLLGYPGQAISSSLWSETITGKEMPMADVIISEGEPYFGAHVTFYTSTDTAENREVKGIKELWTQTLELVYRTLPLEELLRHKQFSESYQRLKSLETGEE